MTQIVELCKGGSCCPRVEIAEHEVRIGEEANLVRLRPAEWQILREKILGGEL